MLGRTAWSSVSLHQRCRREARGFCDWISVTRSGNLFPASQKWGTITGYNSTVHEHLRRTRTPNRCHSSGLCMQVSLTPAIHRIIQQRRSYFFLPTSWKELELRWFRNFDERRTVYVRLLQDRYDSTRLKYRAAKRHARAYRLHYTARRRAAAAAWWQAKKQNGTSRLGAAKLRWKTRSVAVRNHLLRNTRNFADRLQRAMNRSLVRATTSYHKHHAAVLVQKPVTLTEYSEPSWFCPTTGRPMASRDATGRFVNPWLSESTAGVKSAGQIAQWQWERWRRVAAAFARQYLLCGPNSPHLSPQRPASRGAAVRPPSGAARHASKSLAVSRYDAGAAVRSDQLKMTWIGHSTCLVQQGTVSLLTDPIFSARCSPFQSLPIGVAREVPPGVSLNDLPVSIDVCLISHDHYDHLDKESVLALSTRVQWWVVPLGVKAWLQEKCNVGADRIIELEWWESVKLHRGAGDQAWTVVVRHSAIRECTQKHPALTDSDGILTRRRHSDDDNMWLTCCPVQHWCSRTFFDRNFKLWCSYAVFLPGGSKFYFGGDTALPEHFPLFDQIRDYIGGSIDLAALPIGAYEPSFFMADSHMNPSEAVKVHQMLGAKQSVGIHWGTFALSEEPLNEPPVKLREAAEQAKVLFTTVRHGESITVDCVDIDSDSCDVKLREA